MSWGWNARREGNTRIWCRGLVCLGPDCAFMFFIVGLIILCTVLFLCITDGLAARLICGCISAATLGLMWHCSTMDPGICAKGKPLPENAAPRESLMECITYIDEGGKEQHVLVERKWCYSCNIYRPLRSVHCRFCDVCIARRDHHCPWVGTCVGERNYRFYWFFLWSALFLTLTVMISSILSLVRRTKVITQSMSNGDKSAFLAALAETHFVEPLLVVVAFVACWLVAPLALYHTMLVMQNMTTAEELRGCTGSSHYFNRGGCYENTKASLCASIPPSIFAHDSGSDTASTEVVVMVMNDD